MAVCQVGDEVAEVTRTTAWQTGTGTGERNREEGGWDGLECDDFEHVNVAFLIYFLFFFLIKKPIVSSMKKCLRRPYSLFERLETTRDELSLLLMSLSILISLSL